MTKETDERGYYVLAKHVVVEFVLEEIPDLSLSGFSHQNVLFGLWLSMIPTELLAQLMQSKFRFG